MKPEPNMFDDAARFAEGHVQKLLLRMVSVNATDGGLKPVSQGGVGGGDPLGGGSMWGSRWASRARPRRVLLGLRTVSTG